MGYVCSAAMGTIHSVGRKVSEVLGIDQSTTQVWVLADNTVATPTVKQMVQALKLAGEAQTGTFDASRSSSIYGKSTTVQPPAYALIAWRRTA